MTHDEMRQRILRDDAETLSQWGIQNDQEAIMAFLTTYRSRDDLADDEVEEIYYGRFE